MALLATLTLSTYFGKESRADIFVTSIGALGQVWIAVMLWFLTKAQFEHGKRSSEQQLEHTRHTTEQQL